MLREDNHSPLLRIRQVEFTSCWELLKSEMLLAASSALRSEELSCRILQACECACVFPVISQMQGWRWNTACCTGESTNCVFTPAAAASKQAHVACVCVCVFSVVVYSVCSCAVR